MVPRVGKMEHKWGGGVKWHPCEIILTRKRINPKIGSFFNFCNANISTGFCREHLQGPE